MNKLEMEEAAFPSVKIARLARVISDLRAAIESFEVREGERDATIYEQAAQIQVARIYLIDYIKTFGYSARVIHALESLSQPSTELWAIRAIAFAQGWKVCAEWAKRDDLLADIDSPAYIQERDSALAKNIS